ncbi:MAG: 16S rRNA (cytidine(1402)-2'-O)-methyltransferase [Rickettsiales bacterium]|nr:16S rRNA (cytidine(1402)-2'-O)-methyltransferase [Rickettsiales bacterium]
MASNLTDSQDKITTSTGGVLYIVATPIGNLGDMTYRAVQTLSQVDVIACEDTRTSAVLLSHYEIDTPTISYHDHNGAKQRPLILERLGRGESVALISDAGTPLISDPGYKLVHEARALGFQVTPIPGASSVLSALCAAGLPSDQFTFCGFLPNKTQARQKALQALEDYAGTLVFLESPKRLSDMLADAHAVLGAREAVIAREITKRFEEFHSGTLAELVEHYAHAATPKGEIVVLIGPAAAQAYDEEAIDALLKAALSELPTKQAAAHVAEQTGQSKSDLYQRALALKDSQ